MKDYIKKIINRVDFQVILIVVIYTLFATVFTSKIYWDYTFEIIMENQEERVEFVYNTIGNKIDSDTFLYINDASDMETDLYKTNKETLQNLKNDSGVLYLYTAKENENGEFVYVIDGLEEELDFRYPNDLIEEEIQVKMKRALEGESVKPTKILDTDWGYIYVAYYPFKDANGDILGVIGIEIDASNTYNTYLELKNTTNMMGIVLVVVAYILSKYLFKRISNPLYLDKNTKDTPTGLKNRNAFETDKNNLIVRGRHDDVGVIVMDINGLKEVNDRLGHASGDLYINLVAQAIKDTKTSKMIGYRTGGDEFVVFVQDVLEEELKTFIKICSARVANQKVSQDMRCSIACGYSVFNTEIDTDLEDVVNRADEYMYKQKRKQKEERAELDRFFEEEYNERNGN